MSNSLAYQGQWVIDMGGEDGEVVVHFCPYCGENLEETKPQIPPMTQISHSNL